MLPTDFCSMRGVECACEPTRCAAQPQTTPAPVPRFTVRDQLIIISFGFAVSLCVFVAMSAWNEQLGKEAQINQEVNAYAYRR